MTKIKKETLRFPTKELLETFLRYQRSSMWTQVTRSDTDDATVTITGITVAQMAAALDTQYNAIKL
jgi:activator of HSP90 ATPase